MKPSVPQHALLVNPRSGRGKTPEEIMVLHEFCKTHLGDVELFAPSHSSGMRQITEALSDAGCKSFIVAGGDGTLNLIAERLIAAKNTTTTICLLDTDQSSSDLARTVWSDLDNQERLACLLEERTQLVDTLSIEDSFGNHYIALNSCSIGTPAALARKQATFPQTWPRWTKSTIPTIQSLVRPQIFHTLKNGDAVAMIFSNGRYAGGGLQFAPEANIHDGKFDVTTIRPGSIINSMMNFRRLYSHGLTTNKLIEKSSHHEMNVVCRSNVVWEHDGEFGETRSLTIRCQPNSLRFVVPRGA